MKRSSTTMEGKSSKPIIIRKDSIQQDKNNKVSGCSKSNSKNISKSSSSSKGLVGKENELMKINNRENEVVFGKELDQLAPEIVLEILDYYVGYGFKACLKEEIIEPNRETLDFNSLRFDESLFYKQYYGKFTNRGSDTSPKLIFKRGAVPVDDYRSATEFHHLLKIMTSLDLPIDNYFRMLCGLCFSDRSQRPTNLQEQETKRLEYISNVFGKDKDLCEKITTLDLKGLETFEGVIDFAANYFPNIERVSVGIETKPSNEYVFNRTFSLADAVDSICKLSDLKELTIIGKYHYECLSEISVSLPKLQKISIRSSESIVKIGKSIGNWKELKELKTAMKFDIPPYQSQTDFMTGLFGLRIEKLSLQHEAICNSSFHRFPSSITVLDLGYANINSQQFQSISELHSLKILYLDGTSGFQKEDFQHLTSLTNLEVLSISKSSQCGDVGAKFISQIESLKKVYLSSFKENQISDEGGIALSRLSNLETIDLQHCEITEKTIDNLVRNCKNISKIYVAGCKKISRRTKLDPTISPLLEEKPCNRIHSKIG